MKNNLKGVGCKQDSLGDSEIKTDAESDSDSGQCCMKDSPSSWLEKWWESKASHVKGRITAVRSGKRSIPTNPGTELNGKRIAGKRAVILTSTLEEFVRSESMAKDTYSVQLHAPCGLGMSLFVSYDGYVEVEGLHYLPDRQPSPALLCGVIHVGDELIKLNDINLENLTFQSKTDVLKNLDLYAKDVVTLGFRYGKQTPSVSNTFTLNDDDHLNEFDAAEDAYKSQESEEDSDCEGVTQLNLVQCGDLMRRSDETSNKIQNYDQMVPVGIKSTNSSIVQFKETRFPAQRGTNENCINPRKAECSGIVPRKDDPIDDFLAIFGGVDCSQHLTTYGESEMQGIRSVLQSVNHRQWIASQAESTVKTSELALIQRDILSRHLYPSVARISSIASGTHVHHILHELAEDIFEWRPYQLSYMYSGYFTQTRVKTTQPKFLQNENFSRLIVSPSDTACYKYTEHLWWDENLQTYIPVPPLKSEYLRSFIDHRDCMKSVLLRLELDGQRRAMVIEKFRPRRFESMHPLRDVSSVWRNSMTADDFFEADIEDGCSDRQIGSDSTDCSPDAMRKQRISSPDFSPSPILANQSQTVSQLEGGSAREMQGFKVLGEADILSQTQGIQKLTSHSPYVSFFRRHQVAKRVNYFKKMYDHIISPDHSLVQRLLQQNSSNTISMLRDAVEAEISELIETSNPFQNARHFETDAEISLPNILLTYQIFYVLQCLPEGIINGRDIYSVLEKWSTTFNPKGIISACAQMKRSGTKNGLPNRQNSSRVDRDGFVSYRKATENKGPSKEFVVYFGNNRRTAGDLRVFIEVVSDLITLLVLGRVAPTTLTHSCDESFEGKERPSNQYRLRHLPFQMNIPLMENIRPINAIEDSVCAGFVRKFGGLLHLDLLSHACCYAQFRETLSAVFRSALLDEEFLSISNLVQDFLLRSRTTVMGAVQFLDRIELLSSSSPKKPYRKLNCLILQNLRFLFENNVAIAVDLSVLRFPSVRPWNVYNALFGDGCADHRSLTSGGATSCEPLVQAASTFYTYITRLMRSQYDVCSADHVLVLTWLDLALQLDAESALSQNEPINTLFFSPQGKRKSSYLVTVRTILQRPREYSLSLLDALRVCAAHEFCEGVVLLSGRWVSQQAHIQSTAINLEDLTNVLRIIESTVGTLFMQFVLGVETEINRGADIASTFSASNLDLKKGNTESDLALLSHISALLAQGIVVLREIYLISSGEDEYRATLQLTKTLEPMIEESLGVFVSECGEQYQTLIRHVTNIFGDVLLHALDTRHTLEIINGSAYLHELLS